MLIKVKSAYFYGIEAYDVDVELNFMDRSMPGFEVIGLAGRDVTESRERVKNAILNTYKEFPYGKRIVANLAPADVPKEGSYYDLPIAAAIISYMRGVKFPEPSAFFGEVSMDGSLRKTRGVFLFASFAREKGLHNIFIPIDCYNEVSGIKGLNIYPLKTLWDLERYTEITLADSPENISSTPDKGVDFGDVVGQETAKRALEIAACGGHSIMMVGSPGSGKSMLAKSLNGILPPLQTEEANDVAKIYSASGQFDEEVIRNRLPPFRSPHHTISYSGMIGGGTIPRPGEISLAHKGVLFLDEFSEFQAPIIECLRQPMEDGTIRISRSRGSVKLPCEFILVACSNPCPCGYFGDRKTLCLCKPPDIQRYRRKLSGPIMDRIDIFVRVWSPIYDKDPASKVYLSSEEKSSELIRSRVIKVREIQSARFLHEGRMLNARMTNDLVKKYCRVDSGGAQLLDRAIARFNLSPRSIYKIFKVARTIADMAGNTDITAANIAESVQYKNMI